MIRIERVYGAPASAPGARFLVDRLWPRGIGKDALRIDAWVPEAGPSHELRRWFGHRKERWDEFRRRYFAELEARPTAWEPILSAARHGDVALLYGARDTEHNQAVALKEFLEARLKPRRSSGGRKAA